MTPDEDTLQEIDDIKFWLMLLTSVFICLCLILGASAYLIQSRMDGLSDRISHLEDSR